VTLNDQYTDNTHRAETAAAKVTDAWAEGIKKASEQFRTPTLPHLPTDPTVFVEQWFDFTDRLTKVNREYALHLTSVVNELGGAVRQHMEGLSEAVRDQVQSVSHTAKDQLAKVADAEREQVEQAEQAEREAEREQVREARAAERQKTRQERQAAQERYQDMNKSELSDELARRELPKTGTVDELVERLVDADTK
jgi:flagellar biosynthesis GTPase FlhF